jgi:hypothetical protein
MVVNKIIGPGQFETPFTFKVTPFSFFSTEKRDYHSTNVDPLNTWIDFLMDDQWLYNTVPKGEANLKAASFARCHDEEAVMVDSP